MGNMLGMNMQNMNGLHMMAATVTAVITPRPTTWK
jgi:hypothetical protein